MQKFKKLCLVSYQTFEKSGCYCDLICFDDFVYTIDPSLEQVF